VTPAFDRPPWTRARCSVHGRERAGKAAGL
jgi:hypothetical protein